MASSSSSSSVSSANVASAVSFLRDPSVQDAPLAKKIDFLQAKGLSQSEIDAAFRQAQSTVTPGQAALAPRQGFGGQQQYGQQYGYGYGHPQDRMRPDWRDWFIMAVVSGGVGTLMYSLARKYLMPALKPPSETELSAAQDALTAKYDEAAAVLASLQQETSEIKSTLESQCAKVDESVGLVSEALDGIKERERERDEEVQSMKEEVDTLKSLIERMFEKHKDAQSESLKDIEQEVKSLKSLLARRPGEPSSTFPSSTSHTAISRSASPSASASNLSAQAASYQPHQGSATPVYPSPSRFGVSAAGAAGSSSSGMSPSSSFANILNRPPGIPAWQMRPPPATAPSASAEKVEPPAKSAVVAEDKDKGYSVEPEESKNEDASKTGATTSNGLEESGEIVPSGIENTT